MIQVYISANYLMGSNIEVKGGLEELLRVRWL